MPDTPTPKKAGPRLQHVVAHRNDEKANPMLFDEIRIYGQELDALRAIIGKPDWVYAAVAHGQNFTDQLKAARS
jgi:hypothetical protein